MKEIIRMMLVVLSTAARGDLDKLGLTYSSETPYIRLEMRSLPKRIRNVMYSYYDLLSGINDLNDDLSAHIDTINKYSDRVKFFREQITEKTEEHKYSMMDKIAAVKNTNVSWKKLTNAPKQLYELLKVSQEVKEQISEVCGEAQVPPHSDRLISRGV